jgi:hypothetical protein
LQSLQRFAADLNCSVFIVAEQNRASMGTDRQEASAGSRVYEYSAELIVALTRDRDAKPDTNGEVPIVASLVKNRHGDAGEKIDLRFSGRLMTFREGDGSANGKSGLTKLASVVGNHNGRSA